MDFLIDPLRDGIIRRALLDLVILGSICGPLGVWVVLHRQSYAAESLAHSMLPGIVIAALVGAPLGLGAAAGLALAAAAISLATRARSVDVDSAVAVAVTTLFGLGALLALAPDAPVGLAEILFGDPLAASPADLATSAALALAGLAALAAGHRALALGGFDPASAPSLGARPARAALLLLALLALATLVAVGALGNLLVVAILIGPAAAALRLCDRLLPALLTAAALAIGAGLAGIYLSYWADLAAGASVALCAVATFALAPLLPALAGQRFANR